MLEYTQEMLTIWIVKNFNSKVEEASFKHFFS